MTHNNSNDLIGAIAVIGMAGRFPKARNLDEFWENLVNSREVVTFFTEEELLAAGVDAETIQHPHYVPARAYLEDVDQFDAEFFGISPREAQSIDPQQRIFLECAWEALEHAGYDTERYEGAIGVFGGTSMNTYMQANLLANPAAKEAIGGYQVMIGNDKDYVATRTSYKLNLKGPSLTVQTACSTTLVAVQMACQSLLAYQCDAAIAGGASVTLPQKSGYVYQPGMIMSPDGHCRAFDSQAHGIVGGEGVGLVVLKRYEDAIQDGDTIHAIIRGIAINNDGGVKVGFTAPSVDGQAEAILMAQGIGGVEPGSITYVEAHGTGTELGDPIEVSALTQAFRTGTQDKGYCAIGSVKTNMGHLDVAAGIAGLLKTVLALKHKTLPASLHFQSPNPQIDFASSPFYVNAQCKPWNTDRLPRRAGVSSFGIGGTNAHAVLEEAPEQPAGHSTHREQVLLLSARSANALQTATNNLARWLEQNPQRLADAAYTLQVGRRAFKHRRIVVCSTADEGAHALETRNAQRVISGTAETTNPAVVFLFPGQGSQYVQMGRDLYQNEPVFRRSVDRCAEILQPYLGLDLRSILYPGDADAVHAEELLTQTWITQPALFAIEFALAQLWLEWGVQPQAMVGHSIGEYVAACLAGVFSLEDALKLVAARGKLMQSLPGGSMLSIPLAEQDLLPLLDEELQLAVINGPKMSVVSGPTPAIERFQADLAARGIASRKLRTSHAFHSAMMDPILEEFRALFQGMTMHAPQIRCLSNLTGTWLSDTQATDANYWTSHLRSTVRFSQNLEALFEHPAILLEVGPGQALSAMARQHINKTPHHAVYASMRHPHETTSDTFWITRTLGELWLEGLSPNWQAYHAGSRLHRIPLPTYPFEHKRHMVDPIPQAATDQPARTARKRGDLSSWFYAPSWQRAAATPRRVEMPAGETWLVFSGNTGLSEQVVKALADRDQQVVTVHSAESYAQINEHSYQLCASKEEDYTALIRSLKAAQRLPDNILQLWNVTENAADTLDRLQQQQITGFFSLLYLAKALGDHAGSKKMQLRVVTSGLQEVVGGEPLQPAQALVTGPCTTIPLEYSNLHCRSIDIEQKGEAVVDRILAEFAMTGEQPLVAHRGPHRWIPAAIPAPLPADSSTAPALRAQGVYLITGGYGGIGMAIAGALAKEVQARLILVGRSGLPERETWQAWLDQHQQDERTSKKIHAIQEMEANGAVVVLEKADSTDPQQMQAVIARAKAAFGALHGVIHAAGIAGGGIMQLKTAQQAQRVLDPKVTGTWVLGTLLHDEPLDFLLLCSSINAVMGAGGQVDYASANAYQDAYAVAKNRTSRYPILSVNWAAWQEVGMAAETQVPEGMRRERDEQLRNGIHPREGYEAFRRIVTGSVERVIVSPVDLEVLRSAVNTELPGTPQPANAAEPRDAEPVVLAGSTERTWIQTVYAPPTTDTEKAMVAVWEELIGVKPIGIHDNYFSLGGHSLMATQILGRIRDHYGVELTLRQFFETTTVAELAKALDALRWILQSAPSSTTASSDEREEISL